MEVNKSSLLGLKAELLRKQQEVANARATNQSFVRPQPKVKLKTISEKVNQGVERRELLDAQESEVPGDVLEKSRKMLEAKSKLYDQLSSDTSNKTSSTFLVNFEAKERVTTEVEQQVDKQSESDDDEDDSDWVEFVDCLGRTRRCLKEDLTEMKRRDEELKRTEGKTSVEKSVFVAASLASTSEVEEPLTEAQSELLSADMQRQLLREKWEKKEQELLGARDVHYQDLLFDEARQHGVGYYAFSTDEAERQRQQQELKNLRKQTEEERQEHQAAESSKKKQLKQRLKAARRRKRERLGLPPEDEFSEEEIEEPTPSPPVEEKTEEVTRIVRKPAQVREWDIGKEDPSRVLSQEEWVAKKRDERCDEFAPPSSFQPPEAKKWKPSRRGGDQQTTSVWGDERNSEFAPPVKAKRSSEGGDHHFLSKQVKQASSGTSVQQEYLQDLKNQSGLFTYSDPSTSDLLVNANPPESPPPLPPRPARVGAEIPPPPCLDEMPPSTSNASDIEKSIEEGLLYLRQEAEKKKKRRGRTDFGLF